MSCDVGEVMERLENEQSSFPGLTPMDLFYWGNIKDIVYSTPVADFEDFHLRMVAACATVMLQKVHT